MGWNEWAHLSGRSQICSLEHGTQPIFREERAAGARGEGHHGLDEAVDCYDALRIYVVEL